MTSNPPLDGKGLDLSALQYQGVRPVLLPGMMPEFIPPFRFCARPGIRPPRPGKVMMPNSLPSAMPAGPGKPGMNTPTYEVNLGPPKHPTPPNHMANLVIDTPPTSVTSPMVPDGLPPGPTGGPVHINPAFNTHLMGASKPHSPTPSRPSSLGISTTCVHSSPVTYSIAPMVTLPPGMAADGPNKNGAILNPIGGSQGPHTAITINTDTLPPYSIYPGTSYHSPTPPTQNGPLAGHAPVGVPTAASPVPPTAPTPTQPTVTPNGSQAPSCSACGCNGHCNISTTNTTYHFNYMNWRHPMFSAAGFPFSFLPLSNPNGMVNPLPFPVNPGPGSMPTLPNGLTPEAVYHYPVQQGQPPPYTVQMNPSPAHSSATSSGSSAGGEAPTKPRSRHLMCSNCGFKGHTLHECSKPTMEAITHSGKYEAFAVFWTCCQPK